MNWRVKLYTAKGYYAYYRYRGLEMNILFFLTPKSEVAYVDETESLRQVLEKVEYHGYTAIPLLSKYGEYLGTIAEGDLLWEMYERNFPTIREMEDIPIMEVPRKRDNKAVNAQADMEDLIDAVMNQNFVPVVDDKNVFIGIITRKDILSYLTDKIRKNVAGKRG